MQATLQIDSRQPRQVIDITDDVNQVLRGVDTGLAAVSILHTTAAITTADLDPGTDEDFLEFLKKITPQADWRHPHDPSHAPDHLLASLIGPSVSLPVEHGQLALGTWQRLIVVELSGPRQRNVTLTVNEV